MKSMATYNWEIAKKARLRKERIINTVFGIPAIIIAVLFISSADSIVDSILTLFGI